MTACQTCLAKGAEVSRAQINLVRAKSLLARHGDAYGGRYITEAKRAKEAVTEAEARLADHVDSEHDGHMPEPDRPITSRLGRVLAAPKPIPDGKQKCLACGRIVSVLDTRLRRHLNKRGDACPNVSLGQTTPLKVPLPEVDIRPLKRPGRVSSGRGRSEPSRLDAGSSCEKCGKWLPGERRLCGRCFARASLGGP